MSEVTPRYIAQQIIRLAEKGDQSRDSELTEREVIPLVVSVATKLLKDEMFRLRQDPEGLRTIPAHLIHTFRKVPVKKLTANGVNFIELPGEYAAMPLNEGVRRIAPFTDNPFENKAMIPVQHEQMDIYSSLLGSMQNQWVYFVEGKKAYFYKKCDKTLCESGINYVSVSLVGVQDMGDESPLQVPIEFRIDIITSVLDLLGATYGMSDVKDVVNDNNTQNA